MLTVWRCLDLSIFVERDFVCEAILKKVDLFLRLF